MRQQIDLDVELTVVGKYLLEVQWPVNTRQNAKKQPRIFVFYWDFFLMAYFTKNLSSLLASFEVKFSIARGHDFILEG